ncbi:Long-chain-alcohol oxidase FAO2 [Escovopsis weberi]|uniref:Long-chain-alcohol oxidase FAO2 n=1 Tax=Escovopsis weberi TaxID=150374 RepID=A0A0M9VTB5_ESCWE|nr:Long-chain-alcohol oxidase FAO2 [Escovopsis weberi]
MSPAAWDVLWALVDGALPSIVPASEAREDGRGGQLVLPDEQYRGEVEAALSSVDGGPSVEDAAAFLAERSIDDVDFRENCLRFLAVYPRKSLLAMVLAFMNTHLGSLVLTGYWNPVYQQSANVRQAVVQSWSQSRFRALRVLGASVATLGSRAMGMTNPVYSALLGYSVAPRDWRPVEGYPFKFMQLDPGDSVHEIVTDVVIVGSGPGGAICAKNLAEAGHKVLLVEKGYHFSTSQLPLTQSVAAEYQQESQGVMASEDSSVALLSASTWGGGGTINWSVCLPMEDQVRREWARTRGGLPFFSSADFDDCLDRVMDLLGAQKDVVRHNHANRTLLDGAEKLGWHAAPLHRNTRDKEHSCGHCHYGCPSGEKRGPTVTCLPPASEAGAEFMEGFSVDRVLFDEGGSGEGQGGVPAAIGVEGVWTSRDAQGGIHAAMSARTQRRVIIKAKKVIISAGTLWSPVILQKSGLKNPNIGRGVHLHPCLLPTAFYKKETRPWEGSIISTYSSEFSNLDGNWHGAKLEASAVSPSLFHMMQCFGNGLDSKLAALRLNHAQCILSFCRDRDSGRVFTDPASGTPRIDYTPSKFDASNVLKGATALTKIFYATGATEIRSIFPGLEAFRPKASAQEELGPGQDPELTDADFAQWLARMRALCDANHLAPTYISGHQMGSCPMSSEAELGAVDEKGKVWGTENLYVADSSVFPSASGVNPMVTIMAIADWISRGVANELSLIGSPA